MKQVRNMALALFALLALAQPALAAVNKAPDQAVNINTASVEELTTLPHIGPKRAEQIVARRQEKPFVSVDELLEIKGIGPKTLEKLRPHIALNNKKHP